MFAALGAAAWRAAAQRRRGPGAAVVRGGRRHGPGHAGGRRPRQPLQRDRRRQARARRSPATLPRVYVPNRAANTVSVIDPTTLKVIDTFKVGIDPQHVVPSWDLSTLWVTNNAEGRTDGSLTPIDPADRQARHGRSPVDDPYNMYWHARRQVGDRRRRGASSGSTSATRRRWSCSSIDDAGLRRHQPRRLLDRRPLRDLHLRVQRLADQDRPGQPQGAGHDPPEQVLRPARGAGGDRQAGQEAEARCPTRAGAGEICTTPGMPQDIRISPDGKTLLRRRHDGRRRAHRRRRVVQADRLHPRPASAPTACTRAATARSCTSPTAAATRSAASRAGTGSVSVIDFASGKVRRDLADPRRRQPRHGQRQRRRQVPVALRPLRRRGLPVRHDDRARSTRSRSAREPHGLTVWPQPGRYSLGHTGNLR